MESDEKLKSIPVRLIGPGSQVENPDGQTLAYIEMPSDMARFEVPDMPPAEAVRELAAARDTMQWLQSALAEFAKASAPQMANLGALDAANRELVHQILGEGEVSVRSTGVLQTRSQESVLAGVWRTLYLNNDGDVCYDVLEVGDVPHTVRMSCSPDQPVNINREGIADELANALGILVELRAYSDRYQESAEAHTINLTLLPLSPAELEFLHMRLGRGAVDTLSRAYGKCQISSTLTRNVWWVRYYNSMGTLILNTLEVVDVPAAIRAAADDIADSATRLADMIAPYWTDAA